MRKFTLLAVSAAMAINGMAQSATTSVNKIEQAQAFAQKYLAVKKAHANKAAMKETAKMPRTINEYSYSNGDWTLEAQHNYRYDSKSGSLVMEEITANDKSNKVRNVYTYDEKETSFCTSETQSTFTPASSSTSTKVTVSKKDVKRDAQGRITEVSCYEYNENKNDLELTYRNTFEYGENGKPTKMTRVSNTTDENNSSSVMTMTLSNIVWDSYDGNLLTAFGTSDEDMVLDPANRIMTADMKLEFSGESQSFEGTVTGEYSNNKSSLDLAVSYGSIVIMDEKYTDEILDNNGSHRLSMEVQTMDVNTQEYTPWLMDMTMLYNEKGEELEETVRQGTTTSDLEIQQSVKYDNSYDEETGLRTSAIISQYNSSTKTYIPVTKLEIEKYVDVVTAIDGVNNNAVNGNAQIFNAQGMFMGNDLTTLPSGLYIVKQNGKSVKVNK